MQVLMVNALPMVVRAQYQSRGIWEWLHAAVGGRSSTIRSGQLFIQQMRAGREWTLQVRGKEPGVIILPFLLTVSKGS